MYIYTYIYIIVYTSIYIYIHIIVYVYIYITSDYSHHHPPQADTVRAVRGAMATAAMARDPNVEAADFRGIQKIVGAACNIG